jgi:hypothetical protein
MNKYRLVLNIMQATEDRKLALIFYWIRCKVGLKIKILKCIIHSSCVRTGYSHTIHVVDMHELEVSSAKILNVLISI